MRFDPQVYSIDEAKDVLEKRRAAFQAVFRGPQGVIVLDYLSSVCFVNKTTALGNRDAGLVAEGRRQVWLDIQKYLNLKAET